MSRPLVNTGTLFWTGQHWINYIRRTNTVEDRAMVSLWHTHYSSVGEGTVAYVLIEGDSPYRGICTDNPELAAFIHTWMSGRGDIYDMDIKTETIQASFTRGGDIIESTFWTIETDDDHILARWSDIQSPVLLEAPAPKFREGWDVYSCLFFAQTAQILYNDQLITGNAYKVDNWKNSLGGERSSCVFALSETFIQADGQGV